MHVTCTNWRVDYIVAVLSWVILLFSYQISSSFSFDPGLMFMTTVLIIQYSSYCHNSFLDCTSLIISSKYTTIHYHELSGPLTTLPQTTVMKLNYMHTELSCYWLRQSYKTSLLYISLSSYQSRLKFQFGWSVQK